MLAVRVRTCAGAALNWPWKKRDGTSTVIPPCCSDAVMSRRLRIENMLDYKANPRDVRYRTAK